MFRRLAALFAFVLTFGAAFSQADEIFAEYGVEVIFSAEPEIFHESWRAAPINGKAMPISEDQKERSKEIAAKALQKYPVELVRKNLKRVYFVARIEFYGQTYGGTNSTDAIYLSNRGPAEGFTDFWVEQAFHSEFSSIFLRNYKFLLDKEQWVAQNAEEVRYGQSGVDALRTGTASTEFDFELNKQGILCQYGLASFEEDFNSYAENLFISERGFWEIAATHPRVEKKLNILVEFFSHLSPKFTLDYFKEISAQ